MDTLKRWLKRWLKRFKTWRHRVDTWLKGEKKP
jgi:hypothetical protein